MNERIEPANPSLSEVLQSTKSSKRDQRRWVVGLALMALLAFNYPWLYIVDAILPPPWPALVLFISWAIIIATSCWLLTHRKS